MRKIRGRIEWKDAPDIKKRLSYLVKQAEIDWVKIGRIFTYRSVNGKTRAYARTWGLPGLWQRALGVTPGYIIEVVSEHFDKLNQSDKDKVLLHEITHIPRNFSGALVPHIRHGKRNFRGQVDELINRYLRNKQ
jgi:predicted metallopeptidase